MSLRWWQKEERMQGLGITLTIQLDRDQYTTIISKLNTIQQLIVQSLTDPVKIEAATAQLKKANDALSAVVTQNQPQP